MPVVRTGGCDERPNQLRKVIRIGIAQLEHSRVLIRVARLRKVRPGSEPRQDPLLDPRIPFVHLLNGKAVLRAIHSMTELAYQIPGRWESRHRRSTRADQPRHPGSTLGKRTREGREPDRETVKPVCWNLERIRCRCVRPNLRLCMRAKSPLTCCYEGDGSVKCIH